MRFSIVTPSLNQGRYVAECLASVASQDVEKEHWVIDGGSSDETPAILRSQSGAHWISEPDRGQTDAINKGLKRTTGDILAYLCADDFLEPRALERVAGIFASNPSIDFVYGDGYFLESDSGWKRLKRAGGFSVERLRRGNFLLQPAVFWRRRVYERYGDFDASLQYCMDHEYWLRTCRDTGWHYLPEPLASCRLHADAKTSRALALAWAEAARMQALYGIHGRPAWDALWMRIAGARYYTLKRRAFALIGRLRK